MTSSPDAPARFSTPPVLITGMSGGGLSSAAKVLEDKGFFVVQNLPRELIAPSLEAGLEQNPPVEKIAFLTDVRSRVFGGSLRTVIKDLTERGMRPTILFMDARDDVLIRRFDSVRRTHPLQGEDTLQAGIDRERELTTPIKELADIVIDASDMSVHDLRRAIEASFGTMAHNRQHVTIESFGFKHGAPRDADLMVDVRFLPNPFWIPELRGYRGTDAPVSDYVLSQEGAGEFLDRFVDMFRSMLAGYRHEGKNSPSPSAAPAATTVPSPSRRSCAAAVRTSELDVNVFHRDIARD